MEGGPARLIQSLRTNPDMKLRALTRRDGSRLRALWGSNAEPNTMILNHLKAQSPDPTHWLRDER